MAAMHSFSCIQRQRLNSRSNAVLLASYAVGVLVYSLGDVALRMAVRVVRLVREIGIYKLG